MNGNVCTINSTGNNGTTTTVTARFDSPTVSGTLFIDNGAGTGGVANNGVKDGTEAAYTAAAVTITATYSTPTGSTQDTTSTTDGTFSLDIPKGATNVVITRPAIAGFTGVYGTAGSGGGTYAHVGSTDTVTISPVNGNVTGVQFGIVQANTLAYAASETGTRSAAMGSTVYYAHTFTERSAGSAVFTSSGTQSGAGRVSLDADCSGAFNAGDTDITGVAQTFPRASGSNPSTTSMCLLAREIVPTTATGPDVVTLSANYTYTSPSNVNSVITQTDTTTVVASISGTIFRDATNTPYSQGNPKTCSSCSNIANTSVPVRVELYNLTGASGSAAPFVSSITTTTGNYTFSNLVVGNSYIVRVVNSTVIPSGYTTGVVAVQTYRTTNGAGDGNRVGGEAPAGADAASNTTSATLNTSTYVLSTGGQAQSVGVVTVPGSGASSVDFGFAFNAIVNTLDSGQGSLRQFLANARTLGGNMTSLFMIPTAQLTSGIAVIPVGSDLTVDVAGVTLDGSTEAVFTAAASNTKTFGPWSVGVSNVMIPAIPGPVVELAGSADRILTASGSSDTISGFALHRVAISLTGSGTVAQYNLVGTHANGTITTNLGNIGISFGSASGIVVQNNLVMTNNSAIRRDGSGSGVTIQYNVVDSPLSGGGTAQTDTFDGILLIGPGSSSGDVVRYNLVQNLRGGGFETGFSGQMTLTGAQIYENTLTCNGHTTNTCGAASTEPANVVFWLTSGTISFYNNVVTRSGGTGVLFHSDGAAWPHCQRNLRNLPECRDELPDLYAGGAERKHATCARLCGHCTGTNRLCGLND